jgi:hypothetical protein
MSHGPPGWHGVCNRIARLVQLDRGRESLHPVAGLGLVVECGH